METGIDHERPENYVHEGGIFGILDSVSFLPFPLRKLPEAFGLTASKSWYSHYFNTEEILDYIGPIPDVSYYGVNEMGEGERNEFHAWYESQK